MSKELQETDRKGGGEHTLVIGGMGSGKTKITSLWEALALFALVAAGKNKGGKKLSFVSQTTEAAAENARFLHNMGICVKLVMTEARSEFPESFENAMAHAATTGMLLTNYAQKIFDGEFGTVVLDELHQDNMGTLDIWEILVPDGVAIRKNIRVVGITGTPTKNIERL